MKFNQLIEHIQKTHKIEVISHGEMQDLLDLKLLEPKDPQIRDTILYFVYDKQNCETLPANCIVVKGAAAPEYPVGEGNLARIEPEAFSSVFNLCSDLLRNAQRGDFYQYYREVADQVRSVDALIDLASQSFGASLILCDRDFRILSYSTQVPVTDELWKQNIRQGFCDYEFITQVRALKAVQTMHDGTDPVEVTCKSSPYRKFACRVYCKGIWIGFILLIEGNDSYRSDHAKMLQLLTSVIGDAVVRYAPNLLYQTNEYHRFLYNLLIGAPPETLPDLYLTLSFPEKLQVVYAKDPIWQKITDEPQLIRQCKTVFPDCHAMIHLDGATIIGSEQDLSNRKKLKDIFRQSKNMKMGISRPFRDIKLVKEALEEAVEAYDTGCLIAPKERIFSFDQYGIYAMFQKLEMHENTERYMHPAIRELCSSGQRDHEMLLETLRVHLQTNCNIKETAEILHMHRNSVTYRLHKIEESYGIDLGDMETCFRLRISFMILRIREIREKGLAH